MNNMKLNKNSNIFNSIYKISKKIFIICLISVVISYSTGLGWNNRYNLSTYLLLLPLGLGSISLLSTIIFGIANIFYKILNKHA